MKNLVTYIQDKFGFGFDPVGKEVKLDANGINAEYFDDGDEFPSLGRTYEIIKVHLDDEGNPTTIDIKEKKTGKAFENMPYAILNFATKDQIML